MAPSGPDGSPWHPFSEPEPTSLRPEVAPWRHGIELHASDAALDVRYPEPDDREAAGEA